MSERLSNESRIPDEQNLFSPKRALRGAKYGATFGLVLTGGGLLTGSVIDGGTLVDLVSSNPLHLLEGLGIVAGNMAIRFGAVGAAIDSFRPTSKITTRFINEEIQLFIGLPKDCYNLGKNFYSFAKRLRGQ